MNRENLYNIVGFETRRAVHGLLLSSGFSSTKLVGFRAQFIAKNVLVGFKTPNSCAFGHRDSGIGDTELAGFRAPNNTQLVGFETQKGILTSRTHESFRCVTLVLNNLIKDQQLQDGCCCSFFSKESYDEC